MTQIIHKELSYKITGLCFQVQRELGRFCREKQYIDRLVELLDENKMGYVREFEIKKLNPDSPKGNRMDLFIENKIIFDGKAKNFITKEDYYQMQRYLRAADVELGLIVNFRESHLKPKRVLNTDPKFRSDPKLKSDPKLRIHPSNPNNINKDLGAFGFNSEH